MNNSKILASAAIAVSIVACSSQAHMGSAAKSGGKEKCYGVSLAGQNDCGNLAGTHSCAGQSKVDNDPGEWKIVPKGTCVELGGLLKADAKKKYKADNQS